MDYEKALEIAEGLHDAGIESHGQLTIQEDAKEFGGSYSLRLKTVNRTLSPLLMGLLNSEGVELTYLGEADVMNFNAEWLVEGN